MAFAERRVAATSGELRNQRSSAAWENLPPALPRTEADFDAWRVFADQLQSAGERVGELMALDLATPGSAGKDAIEALKQKAARLCRQYALFELGWCLGLVRTVFVRSPSLMKMSRAPPADEIDPQAGAALEELLRNPRAPRCWAMCACVECSARSPRPAASSSFGGWMTWRW